MGIYTQGIYVLQTLSRSHNRWLTQPISQCINILVGHAGTTHAWPAQFIFLTFSLGMAQRDTESQGNRHQSRHSVGGGFPTIWCCVPSVTPDPVPSAGPYIQSDQVVKKTVLKKTDIFFSLLNLSSQCFGNDI